ncbi:phasin family protein [Fundidesulfovibrio terrae]|uniref:phasin family protein n=1 Tax=Fundidesulfovibrio terrae TaxID=2922866 RepID=UPI001FAF05C3|nr:phasin family protein [Fundidesulfovibrio terrae]
MSDLLKKGFYTGLGAGLLLKDEILNALNPPVKVDDQPVEEIREQLRTVLGKLAGNMGQGVDALKDAGEAELAGLLERFGLAKAEDVEALKARIADLEAKLKSGKKK